MYQTLAALYVYKVLLPVLPHSAVQCLPVWRATITVSRH